MKWLRRIRGAVLMGLIWAAVWAPAAVLIGFIIDPTDSMDEMWVAAGLYGGFISGVFFAAVLGIAERRRGLNDLSIARVASWGAVAGVLLGLLPFILGDANTANPLLLGTVIVGSTTVLSTISAAGTLALARAGEKRELLRSGS